MDRKKLKNILNTAEEILKEYEKNLEAFEKFNFKVYNFFNATYKYNTALKKLNILDEELVYVYLDNMYTIFEEDFNSSFGNIDIVPFHRTSSRTLKGEVLNGTEWIGDYRFFNVLYELGQGKYDTFEDLQTILQNFKNKQFLKFFKTLKTELEYDDIDTAIEDLEEFLTDLEEDVKNISKAYDFICTYKEYVTIEDFVDNYILVDEDVLKNIKYITKNIIDNINNNYIINNISDNEVEIYTSYAKQPIKLFLVNTTIELLEKLNEV